MVSENKKKSEIKEPGIEIPFICLENHWFIHEVLLGWFQPHTVVAWHWDFQTWGMMRQSHWYRDHYGTAFSSLKYLSYHRAQNCKKVIETIKHDQHRYSTKCHLMFQQRLFLLVIFWKQGLLKCFMTRSPFFPPLKTLCVRLDWQMLERFASIDSSGDCGLSTLNTQIPARGQRISGGQKKDESGWGLQVVVAINPPQVRRKGRWLRGKRHMSYHVWGGGFKKLESVTQP